jgi:hypothetical protein
MPKKKPATFGDMLPASNRLRETQRSTPVKAPVTDDCPVQPPRSKLTLSNNLRTAEESLRERFHKAFPGVKLPPRQDDAETAEQLDESIAMQIAMGLELPAGTFKARRDKLNKLAEKYRVKPEEDPMLYGLNLLASWDNPAPDDVYNEAYHKVMADQANRRANKETLDALGLEGDTMPPEVAAAIDPSGPVHEVLGAEADEAECETCSTVRFRSFGVECKACGAFSCRGRCWNEHWCDTFTDWNGDIVKVGDKLRYHDGNKRIWVVTEITGTAKKFHIARGTSKGESRPIRPRLMTLIA